MPDARRHGGDDTPSLRPLPWSTGEPRERCVSPRGIARRRGADRSDRDTYIALEFTTGASGAGGLAFVNPQAGLAFDSTLVTMSRCAGDFSAQEDDDCRVTIFANGSFTYAVGGTDGACNLQPNTTYFLNLLHTAGPDDVPLVWSCDFEGAADPARPPRCYHLVDG